jgi:hypothetical protein
MLGPRLTSKPAGGERYSASSPSIGDGLNFGTPQGPKPPGGQPSQGLQTRFFLRPSLSRPLTACAAAIAARRRSPLVAQGIGEHLEILAAPFDLTGKALGT